jgi:hypothetical protein
MIVRIFAAFLLATFLAHSAIAKPPEPSDSKKAPVWIDPGWRRTVARYYVKFDEQGLSTTAMDFEYQALNDKGAAAIAQEVFAYNSYFSSLTASDLATVKPTAASFRSTNARRETNRGQPTRLRPILTNGASRSSPIPTLRLATKSEGI